MRISISLYPYISLVQVIAIELLGLGKPIGLQGWAGCVIAIAMAMAYARWK